MRKLRSDQIVEPAVKTIEFRKKRGEKLTYLMKREANLNAEEDDFWNNNKYFNPDNIQSDDESYKQKENEKNDSFDSDFKDSSSDSSKVDENASVKSTKKNKEVKRQYKVSGKTSYIHDYFTQDQLIREAVMTELSNKISLQYLIQVEEDKKKIKIERANNIDGPYMKKIENKEGTLLQFINYENDINFFPKEEVKQPKTKKFKYKDPKSGTKFNTIQEYRAIKKTHKIQDRINTLLKKLNC